MGDIDMKKLMDMISRMDKKELEQGLEKASKVLGMKGAGELKKNLNRQAAIIR